MCGTGTVFESPYRSEIVVHGPYRTPRSALGDHVEWSTRMPDLESSSKPSSKRDARADKQAFNQVEKWMAMIREIDQDRQPEPKRAD